MKGGEMTKKVWSLEKNLAEMFVSGIEKELQGDKETDSLSFYLTELREKLFPILTYSEERKLICQAQNDNKRAKEKIIQSHLRLVIALARRYQNLGLPFKDLIQEGNLGLIQAVEKFDLNRKNRLSAYAIWLIRQAMIRAIESETRPIRLPENVQKKIRNIHHLLHSNNGQVSLQKAAQQMEISQAELEKLLEIAQPVLSLENPVHGREVTLKELVVDQQRSPEEKADHQLLQEAIEAILNKLPPRDKEVLYLRFFTEDSLEQAGKKMGISRERVRQIEEKTLRGIRSQNKELKNFLK